MHQVQMLPQSKIVYNYSLNFDTQRVYTQKKQKRPTSKLAKIQNGSPARYKSRHEIRPEKSKRMKR